MTPTHATHGPARSAARKNLRFALHYVEMLVSMFAGMLLLGPAWSWAFSGISPGLGDRPAAGALVMAANMTIGMGLWMRIRRHSWRQIAEMSAAMVLPFLALLVPYAVGAISGGALMMGGHLLMLPAMLAVMLWRHREYRH